MPDENENEIENEIVVTAKKFTADGGGGGGFGIWGGFGSEHLGGPFFVGNPFFGGEGGGGEAEPPADEPEENSEEENEIVVEADRPTDDDFSEPPLTYGDFIDAFFDFLDGRVVGADGFEFKVQPVDVEYDLSVDVEGERATVTIYDRWNETQTIYSYGSNGNYSVLDVPLDNSDFSREGQHSLRDIPLEYEYF